MYLEASNWYLAGEKMTSFTKYEKVDHLNLKYKEFFIYRVAMTANAVQAKYSSADLV